MPKTETINENIARDIREGRFPRRSDPQVVAGIRPEIAAQQQIVEDAIACVLGHPANQSNDGPRFTVGDLQHLARNCENLADMQAALDASGMSAVLVKESISTIAARAMLAARKRKRAAAGQTYGGGRPKKLSACPHCGELLGVREMSPHRRAHRINLEWVYWAEK